MKKILNITPVVLCGGSGTRLWPLSRTGFPKQFLVLTGFTSLFQQAVSRINQLNAADIKVSKTLVVTNEDHRFLALDQLRELPGIAANFLLEPVGRNTAPALTFAALQASANNDDPILVVTPSDQSVQNIAAFTEALQNAIRVAATDTIVILGIHPKGAETGFGYIKRSGVPGIFKEFNVDNFTEKPDFDTAQAYLNSGDYFWNSGIFVMRTSVWLKALNFFRNDILQTTINAFASHTIDNQFIRPNAEVFAKNSNESVDFAVMERCPNSQFKIKMIVLDAGWEDLGTWDSLWQADHKDDNDNVVQGDVLLNDTHNSLIVSSHRLVSAVKVNNLVIIETADAVLVANRNESQHVKTIVSQLEAQQRKEQALHRKIIRPWGWFDTIDVGNRFKVKRIQVNPGASLSLQRHTKRAEHWVVVKGIAQVICGDKTITLHENESTFIPCGLIHRLSNPGELPIEIIEVQTGDYLGEDDIERFEDNYGRMFK